MKISAQVKKVILFGFVLEALSFQMAFSSQWNSVNLKDFTKGVADYLLLQANGEKLFTLNEIASSFGQPSHYVQGKMRKMSPRSFQN